MTDVFDYLNEIGKVGTTVCPYNTCEELADSTNIMEVFKYMALSIYKDINEKMAQSKVSQKQKVNNLFGADLVKLAKIHINFVGIKIMKQNEEKYKCKKFVELRKNMSALVCHWFVK